MAVNLYVEYGEETALYVLQPVEAGDDLQQRRQTIIEDVLLDLRGDSEGSAEFCLAIEREKDARSIVLTASALATLKNNDTVQILRKKASGGEVCAQSPASASSTLLKRSYREELEDGINKRLKQSDTGSYSGIQQEESPSEIENYDNDSDIVITSTHAPARPASPGPGPLTAARNLAKVTRKSNSDLQKSNAKQLAKEKEEIAMEGRKRYSEWNLSEAWQRGNELPTLIWCQMFTPPLQDLKPSTTILELKKHVVEVEKSQSQSNFAHIKSADDVWVCVDGGPLTEDQDTLGDFSGKKLCIEFRRIPTNKRLCEVQLRIEGTKSAVEIKEIKKAGKVQPLVFSLFDQLRAADARVDARRHSLYFADKSSANKNYRLMELDEFLSEFPLSNKIITIKLTTTKPKC